MLGGDRHKWCCVGQVNGSDESGVRGRSIRYKSGKNFFVLDTVKNLIVGNVLTN